ncbi:MAG: NAD(P)/FAD-dependent oxidoreductase [Cyanophyceae cyanobacterium]
MNQTLDDVLALPQITVAQRRWAFLRAPEGLPPQVIQTQNLALGSLCDWDAVIAGGTLGILLGVALVQRGWRVLLVERGLLRGREQEWNISERELRDLVKIGILTEAELAEVMVTRYNPARIGFADGPEVWIRDVLNVGVDPVQLLEILKRRFLALGGSLLEQTAFVGATVCPDGVAVQLQSDVGEQQIQTRLLIDVMGHGSPLVRQARQDRIPDSLCVVVGTCAAGLTESTTGDLLYSFTPILRQSYQPFWEAFPARDVRTTYLFAYGDPQAQDPSPLDLVRDYWHWLPHYQQTDWEQIQPHRWLCGVFPAYRDSPLQSPWDRILFAGDSCGGQSPLSFGGFGAMVRHLERLKIGIDDLLKADQVQRTDLARLQPYQPNLAVTWLFQQTMCVSPQSPPTDPMQINRLLSTVFAAMSELGDPVMRPFLQDVIQFGGLSLTLGRVTLTHPVLVARLASQLGIQPLVSWSGHFGALGLYDLLAKLGKWGDPLSQKLPEGLHHQWQRWQRTWVYGSGQDFH